MATVRKRTFTDETLEKSNRKRRSSNKGVSFFMPLSVNLHTETTPPVEEPLYTHSQVTALLAKQEQAFRQLLEEKLREQFNIFNQLYVDNIFKSDNICKEYTPPDCSYIS